MEDINKILRRMVEKTVLLDDRWFTEKHSEELLSSNKIKKVIHIFDTTATPYDLSSYDMNELYKINPYLFGQLIKTTPHDMYHYRDYEYPLTDEHVWDDFGIKDVSDKAFEEKKNILEYNGNIDLYYRVNNGLISTWDDSCFTNISDRFHNNRMYHYYNLNKDKEDGNIYGKLI